MSTCPQKYVDYMHEYLDGDISRDHEHKLKKHLQACEPCKHHMHELSDTIAFVKSWMTSSLNQTIAMFMFVSCGMLTTKTQKN